MLLEATGDGLRVALLLRLPVDGTRRRVRGGMIHNPWKPGSATSAVSSKVFFNFKCVGAHGATDGGSRRSVERA